MATWYYDLKAAVNGTGTTVSPFNTFPGTTLSAGDAHLFKRSVSSTATVAFAISSGANGSITRYGAWYNSDGTDDSAQPRPVLVTSSVMSTFGTKKGHLRIENLEILAPSITVANDTSLVFLSDSATLSNVIIDTNVGCVGVWGGSHVTIDGCNFFGVSHSTANNNQVLAVTGDSGMDTITITNSFFNHYGGGGATSHNVILECTSAANALTNLTFQNNAVRPATLASISNHSTIGIRLGRCPGASVQFNTSTYHNTGIQMRGNGTATSATIAWNTCNNNYHFGIHVTTDAVGCLIEHNTCKFNGTNINDGVVLLAYGRGIEITSAAGQSKCASHIVRFNTCANNYNWGGASDNGSEGVGIGLDDGAVNCLVMANTITDNEGNGIQIYGGGSSATWTDTHNTVISNILRNNCTAAFSHRQSGVAVANNFVADIGLSWTYGGISLIANNTHGGLTPAAVSITTDCTSITVANNITLNVPHPFIDGRATATIAATVYQNNDCLSATQRYSNYDTSSNGTMLYTLLTYAGTNDFTFDPLLNASYKIQTGSSAIHAGANVLSATWTDFGGNSFFAVTPSLGAYEYVTPPPGQAGGHERKYLMRGRN